MRKRTEETIDMHVQDFLAVSARYLGLEESPVVALSERRATIAAEDDTDDCCCQAA